MRGGGQGRAVGVQGPITGADETKTQRSHEPSSRPDGRRCPMTTP
jgi:hypothetical protein